VDVAGSAAHRVRQQAVDQLDHRRVVDLLPGRDLVSLLLEHFDVVVQPLHVPEEVLKLLLVARALVMALDQGPEGHLSRDDGKKVVSGDELEVVQESVIGRVGHGDGQRAALALEREDDVLGGDFARDHGAELRDQLGGWVDLFQIQSGSADVRETAGSQRQTASENFRDVLSGTRLGGEKQISDRLFFSFSTGLCSLSTGADKEQQGVTGFVNSIEGKLEYRFPVVAPDQISLRAGREPAASGRCTGTVRGFVATPQQWGLSLFRSWSF